MAPRAVVKSDGKFQRGHTLSVGNRGGQIKKARRWATMSLVAQLDDPAPGKDYSNMHAVIKALIRRARAGEITAIREVFNRVEGLPLARLDLRALLGGEVTSISAINQTKSLKDAAAVYAETMRQINASTGDLDDGDEDY